MTNLETLPKPPMSVELAAELQEWQNLGQESWRLFLYGEDELLGNVLPETCISES